MCLLWFQRIFASTLCHSFYLQLNGHSPLFAREPYQGIVLILNTELIMNVVDIM